MSTHTSSVLSVDHTSRLRLSIRLLNMALVPTRHTCLLCVDAMIFNRRRNLGMTSTLLIFCIVCNLWCFWPTHLGCFWPTHLGCFWPTHLGCFWPTHILHCLQFVMFLTHSFGMFLTHSFVMFLAHSSSVCSLYHTLRLWLFNRLYNLEMSAVLLTFVRSLSIFISHCACLPSVTLIRWMQENHWRQPYSVCVSAFKAFNYCEI